MKTIYMQPQIMLDKVLFVVYKGLKIKPTPTMKKGGLAMFKEIIRLLKSINDHLTAIRAFHEAHPISININGANKSPEQLVREIVKPLYTEMRRLRGAGA
jgi:hypothetical protein